MSCPYYWWNYNYACRKGGKDVNEDIYYKYCRNYDYDDCPIYKQEISSNNGCYITTACVKTKNLPDDCYELKTLRKFRDDYVKKQKEGVEIVNHYYDVAPRIVAKIEEKDNAQEIFGKIYQDLIITCINLIEENQEKQAYELYKSYTLELQNKYL